MPTVHFPYRFVPPKPGEKPAPGPGSVRALRGDLQIEDSQAPSDMLASVTASPSLTPRRRPSLGVAQGTLFRDLREGLNIAVRRVPSATRLNTNAAADIASIGVASRCLCTLR